MLNAQQSTIRGSSAVVNEAERKTIVEEARSSMSVPERSRVSMLQPGTRAFKGARTVAALICGTAAAVAQTNSTPSSPAKLDASGAQNPAGLQLQTPPEPE